MMTSRTEVVLEYTYLLSRLSLGLTNHLFDLSLDFIHHLLGWGLLDGSCLLCRSFLLDGRRLGLGRRRLLCGRTLLLHTSRSDLLCAGLRSVGLGRLWAFDGLLNGGEDARAALHFHISRMMAED